MEDYQRGAEQFFEDSYEIGFLEGLQLKNLIKNKLNEKLQRIIYHKVIDQEFTVPEDGKKKKKKKRKKKNCFASQQEKLSSAEFNSQTVVSLPIKEDEEGKKGDSDMCLNLFKNDNAKRRGSETQQKKFEIVLYDNTSNTLTKEKGFYFMDELKSKTRSQKKTSLPNVCRDSSLNNNEKQLDKVGFYSHKDVDCVLSEKQRKRYESSINYHILQMVAKVTKEDKGMMTESVELGEEAS